MARHQKAPEIKCNVVMTEGAEARITKAFVDLYYELCARGEMPDFKNQGHAIRDDEIHRSCAALEQGQEIGMEKGEKENVYGIVGKLHSTQKHSAIWFKAPDEKISWTESQLIF